MKLVILSMKVSIDIVLCMVSGMPILLVVLCHSFSGKLLSLFTFPQFRSEAEADHLWSEPSQTMRDIDIAASVYCAEGRRYRPIVSLYHLTLITNHVYKTV
jgi:hypothetical protein